MPSKPTLILTLGLAMWLTLAMSHQQMRSKQKFNKCFHIAFGYLGVLPWDCHAIALASQDKKPSGEVPQLTASTNYQICELSHFGISKHHLNSIHEEIQVSSGEICQRDAQLTHITKKKFVGLVFGLVFKQK